MSLPSPIRFHRVLDGCIGPRMIVREANGVFLKTRRDLLRVCENINAHPCLVLFLFHSTYLCTSLPITCEKLFVQSSFPLRILNFRGCLPPTSALMRRVVDAPLSSFHNNTAGKDKRTRQRPLTASTKNSAAAPF